MATIRVVILASRIVTIARSKPCVIAVCGGDPLRISSRIRAKINTLASTAIPTVSTMPAMPGKVSVAPSRDMMPTNKIRLPDSAITAAMPNTR